MYNETVALTQMYVRTSWFKERKHDRDGSSFITALPIYVM